MMMKPPGAVCASTGGPPLRAGIVTSAPSPSGALSFRFFPQSYVHSSQTPAQQGLYHQLTYQSLKVQGAKLAAETTFRSLPLILEYDDELFIDCGLFYARGWKWSALRLSPAARHSS